QVEAAADGSLSPEDARRMRRAIESDAALAAAVERARSLRKALRALGREPVPRSLTRRLLGIGRPAVRDRAPRGPVWSWATAVGTAGAVALAMLVLTQAPAPPRDERTAALQEFELAMAYLHRSCSIAGEHGRRAMERQLSDALWLRRRSGRNGTEREGNGG